MMASEDRSGKAAAEKSPSSEDRLVESKVRAAKRAILFENLWPRVWLPVAVCGVFVLLSAFEVWQLLPPRLHLGLLWVFGVALALSFLPLVLWTRPTRDRSIARIEQASALEHRPLTAYNDKLSQEAVSPETAALWQAHRARAARSLTKLKAGPARPRIDRYDPFALRALLVLMLVAVAAWASTDLPDRVHAAFKVPERLAAGPDFRIDAWISPPPYTRKEPFVLANASGGNEPISVPQGSVLTVKINGPGAKGYKVSLNSSEHSQALEPAEQTGDSYAEYTQTLDQSATLVISGILEAIKSWPLTVEPDGAPTIAFTGPIEVSHRAVMLFKYKVNDDYGVASAEARVERVTEAPQGGSSAGAAPQIGKPPVFPLSLPRTPVKAADGKTYKDLTAHPWAGLPVVVTLAAKDEAGHVGYSAPRGIILPERKFTKPLAKAVIDQRRSLVENPADTNTTRIASNLNALGITAQDEGAAPTIYLGLRSAYWRLRNTPAIEEVESVVDQLWDIAVRIEDGNLSSAERDLRAAQERLKDAIERGASQEEIQKLMSELRQALNNYLQALKQQQGKSDKTAQSPNAQTISPQDLQQLLDKIERLAKAGSADAAAQMLNELRDILESIQTAKGGSGSEEEDKENLQRLDRMTDILRQQQQLLDETFRAQQQGSEGEQGDRDRQGQRGQRGQGQRQQGQGQGKNSADLKGRQDDLQRQLQDLLGDMGSKDNDPVMKKLQEAEGAMGDAGEALKQNDLGEAGDQEGRAVENLRQGARGMAEQMMRSGSQRGGSQANRDPLGRKQGDRLDDGDSVKVPDEITVQRARAILDELRKRLGQPSRPPIELDYLERLVKPY